MKEKKKIWNHYLKSLWELIIAPTMSDEVTLVNYD